MILFICDKCKIYKENEAVHTVVDDISHDQKQLCDTDYKLWLVWMDSSKGQVNIDALG